MATGCSSDGMPVVASAVSLGFPAAQRLPGDLFTPSSGAPEIDTAGKVKPITNHHTRCPAFATLKPLADT